MNNPLQNQQQHWPTNSGESDKAIEDVDVLPFWNFPPSPLYFPIFSPPPSPPLYFPTASNSMVIYPSSLPPRAPCSFHSVLLSESVDFDLLYLEKHDISPVSKLLSPEILDISSLEKLDFSSLETVDFSSAKFLRFVVVHITHSCKNWLPYIAGDLALWRQMLRQFWIDDESDNWGPRGGIMTINKQNLPQSECLGISLYLYVEDEFYPLYWHGESWNQLKLFMSFASMLFPGEEFRWMYTWHDSELKNYGQGLFMTDRVSMGVWRIGPRQWVAKIRYRQYSLPKSFFINYQGRVCVSWEVASRNRQVEFENARLHFPDLVQVFHHADTGVTFEADSLVLHFYSPRQFSRTARHENPDEDFVNSKVEPIGIGGEVTEEAEIAESKLNPVPSGKRKRKEKTPKGGSGNKKTTQVRNVTNFEKILQVKEMPLKDAAELLKVVDEESFPQLNSGTLPSDQDLAVTVGTNSVVGNEIPPLHFSATAQQKNSDEAFENEEEEGEIWAKKTKEGGIAEVQFDSRCFAKRKKKEKSPKGERRNKKTTGVRIKGRSLKDDAKHLKGVKPTKFQWRARLRPRELKVDDTPSSKKQSKSVKGGTSRNTSRGGFAESNVDVNTAGGQTSSKKRSTSVIGKRKMKIKKPCSTEPTNENEGEVHETAFRSSLRGIITLTKELDLRNCHKEVLKRTPFWGIFEAIIENKLTPKQCRKSDKMIIEIINTYDPDAKIFRLGRESMELTRADIVSIFGISCGNKSVDLKYGPKERVKLVKRREISEPRLTSKSLKQLLEKYLGGEEKDDIEDVARLLCLYLFHTFLFPTGPTVKWVFLERIEDLDRLRDYDWNKAIINELMSSIDKYHLEPRKVTGCVMALLYWLCEHTNLSQALHPEHPLGIVKWSIPIVVSRFKQIWLKDLKPSQVVSRQANVAGTDDEVPMDEDILQDSVSSGDVSVSNRGNHTCSEAGFQCDEALPSPSTNSPDCDNERTAFTDMEIPQLKRDILPSNQALETTVDTNNVWVKARYVKGIIKFRLYWPWRMVELEQEVKKRLKFEAEAYSINYKDEVNELILIACDEDLEECISSSRALGTNPIEVFLELK